MADNFTFDRPEDTALWQQVLRDPVIWYKIRFSEILKVNVPYSESSLLSWLISNWGGEIIPCTCLFENQVRLSTQVPMRRTYYTDNSELCLINGAMSHINIVYTDQFHDIKRLQKIITDQQED